MRTRPITVALTRDWQPFPAHIGDVKLCAEGLRQVWAKLHRGDREPYPKTPSVQDAWRGYHRGDFARAVVIGLEAGADGLVVAAFAGATYASYLEQAEPRKRSLFHQVMAWCEQAQAEGLCSPNLHYIHGVAIDGYSQTMSVIETVTQGFGLGIRGQAERCLAFDDGHADAHILLAHWHAQLSVHAGQLMAALLFGANREAAIAHYELGVQLAPDSPIPYTAYAAGLELMFADSKKKQVIALLTDALGKSGLDAKQRLDQGEARKRLQALRTAPVESPKHIAVDENRPD